MDASSPGSVWYLLSLVHWGALRARTLPITQHHSTNQEQDCKGPSADPMVAAETAVPPAPPRLQELRLTCRGVPCQGAHGRDGQELQGAVRSSGEQHLRWWGPVA